MAANFRSTTPQLYDGNWTVMRHGRVFVVTFSIPIVSCDFLEAKDKYVQVTQ